MHVDGSCQSRPDPSDFEDIARCCGVCASLDTKETRMQKSNECETATASKDEIDGGGRARRRRSSTHRSPLVGQSGRGLITTANRIRQLDGD